MKKRVLGVVLALTVAASFTSYAGQWIKAGDGWSYIKDDGQPIKEGWFTDKDGKVYNFNGGVTRKGWYQEEGKTYFFSQQSGERMSGLVDIDGKKYFFDAAGLMQTGWTMINDFWYYAKEDGQLAKGLTTIGGMKFYFMDDGHMAMNEWTENGTYYATASGEIASDQWIDSDTYVGSSGKVSDSPNSKATDKKKLQNKVYSDEEYAEMMDDHMVRYSDQCEALIDFINAWRMDYNEDHVWNYSGDDDDYIDEHELGDFTIVNSLSEAATLRAMELASQQRASGARPNGKDWETVCDDRGATGYTKVVESVAFGQSDSEDAYEDLEASGQHTTYWRDQKYEYAGVGAACDVDGKMYWVIIYAQ